jgi:isopentenyl diphosphate isomerase/L-lactate dehydrogenase-like FMN-dependent dehydrogenase
MVNIVMKRTSIGIVGHTAYAIATMPTPTTRVRKKASVQIGSFTVSLLTSAQGEDFESFSHDQSPHYATIHNAMPTPVNLDEYEPIARERMPQPAFDYVAGGAEDELTLADNRDAFQRIRLLPRFLTGVSKVDLSTEVLGHKLAMPVMLAPVALQKLAHPDGEAAAARAAADTGILQIVSTVSSLSLEDIAAATDAPRWFQLYCYQDRDVNKRLVERAEAAGYTAIVMTIDVPRLGRRERDMRNLLSFPEDVGPGNFATEANLSSVPDERRGSALAMYWNTLIHDSLSWDDVDWLRSLTSLPVLLKGVLHPDDATKALDHGVSGIVVSNHGGRQLDGSPAGIDALPAVVEAVAGRVPVLVDGGVRRGTDVIKALALGAEAVLIGRPYVYGLAVGGQAGAARVLALLREEIEVSMALLGVDDVKKLDRTVIWQG